MLQNFDIDQIVQVMNIVTHGGDGNELELIVAAAKMVIQNYSTGTAKFRLIFNEHRKKLDASGLNQSNGIKDDIKVSNLTLIDSSDGPLGNITLTSMIDDNVESVTNIYQTTPDSDSSANGEKVFAIDPKKTKINNINFDKKIFSYWDDYNKISIMVVMINKNENEKKYIDYYYKCYITINHVQFKISFIPSGSRRNYSKRSLNGSRRYAF
jgi:hypothetical protein